MRYYWALLLLFLPTLVRAEPCQRVVPLAPSLAEIVYELGMETRIAAVPAFTTYPAVAKQKPTIGALTDLNYEALLMQKPDMVLALSEFRERIPQIRQLGLVVEVFEHRSLRGVLESIDDIGAKCAVATQAHALVSKLKAGADNVRKRYASQAIQRVLVVVAEASGTAKSYFLSGTDGYFSDVLQLVAGKNVVQTETFGQSNISAEGILALDPDVIVEILPVEDKPEMVEAAIAEWRRIPGLRAVQNGRVHIFTKDYHTIPGPRFLQLAEDLGRILHPQVRLHE
jgi:iron complex transport system substrate-binding protein